MEIGICFKQSIIVGDEMTAKALGSGELPVYATPSMIALMENTAYRCVAPYLAAGQGTVGVKIKVDHVSATPVGLEVSCEARLIDIDNRRLVFEVRAFDSSGLIGEGTHERVIIENERFLRKAAAKA